LTIYLMLVSAVAMAAITVAEALEDTGRTPYRLYLSFWFTGLLWAVWINLACNAIKGSWWSRKRLPGSLMHVGFLLILTGGFFTWQLGVRGDLPISEESSARAFRVEVPVLHLDIQTADSAGAEDYALTEDGVFQPRSFLGSLNPFGPRSVHIESNGQRVTIVDRMVSSRIDESIVEAPAGTGRAAILLGLDSNGERPLVLREGDSISLDGKSLSTFRFGSAGRAEDLVRSSFGQWIEIKPPGSDPIFVPIDLPGDIGAEKTEGEYTVKILEYHPDFKMGRDPSPDDAPLNPAVKLDLSGPGGQKILYSFALVEFHGNRLDDGTAVEFHLPPDSATLLLIPDGSGGLQAWEAVDREPRSLTAESPLEIDGGTLRVSLTDYYAGSLLEKKIVADTTLEGPPAFRIQIGEDGEPAWISADGRRAYSADGRIEASIGATMPLGFELTLDDAVAEYWPASGIPKAYYSFVKVKDHASATPRKARIETNAPLLKNRYRLYQSGMDQQPPYRYSVFAVAFDPGLPFVTIGFLIMTAGLLWFYTNRFVRAPLRKRRNKRGTEI